MFTPILSYSSDLSDYLTDTYQRSLIFLDILRQRGDEQASISERPLATVFVFEHEIIMSGHALKRPINYYLGHILPPRDCAINPKKPPVVVIDPRAGQGPGISGFKPESEIGEALAEGHPVYFIAFSAQPLPGQTFLDVIDGQVAFFEHIVDLHPNAPRPIAIGNCQAGYQTFMAAMLKPDLLGTLIMAGSPLSYWQGVHGKNPMRYMGGLLGGSWINALISDLGNGKFDGANLITNFDNLNPANFLWSKQYHVYANIDNEPKRYLGFEKWWGDFIFLNGDEIQYLVDKLFIGNKLSSNQLYSNDGHRFDLRNFKKPIICFTSRGDHISPPQQALGWILDLYRSTEEIREREQTIVYCVDATAGHLAIFVSGKIAEKEDAAFVRNIDLLECLPPGLYEIVLTPSADNNNHYIANFKRRTLDDIRAFGRNSVDDDRAFDTVSRLSEINLSSYRCFVQPFVRSIANETLAEWLRTFHPLRLSYSLFSSKTPGMSSIESLANHARENRKPINQTNPYLIIQNIISNQIESFLSFYGQVRDQLKEHYFFNVYDAPVIQGLLGTQANTSWSCQPPALTPEEEATFLAKREESKNKIHCGTIDDALVRALLFVVSGEKHFDEQLGHALYQLALKPLQLHKSDIKKIVREQALILHINSQEAIQCLPDMVTSADDRAEILKRIHLVMNALPSVTEEANHRIEQLTNLLEE